jgi:hypothetical protein
MPKYPDDDYLSRQEIDDLRSEAKHAAKYMKAFFDFKIEASYSFSVKWSAQDGEFVGLCAEFPSLSWLDQTLIKHAQALRDLSLTHYKI